MTMKTIDVIVGPDGGIKIEATGFKGADCEKATAFLEKALGTVGKKTRKPEYYRRERLRQRQGIGR